MTYHKDLGLIIFVDVSPSEQIIAKKDEKFAYVAVATGGDVLQSLKHDFKNTKGKPQKLNRAKEFISHVNEGMLGDMYAISVTLDSEMKKRLAEDSLNSLPDKKSNWIKKFGKVYFRNSKIDIELPASQAGGVGAYVYILPILALKAVHHWLKYLPAEKRRVVFVLDNLPVDSKYSEKAIKLLTYISQNSDVNKLWENFHNKYKAEFSVVLVENILDGSGKQIPKDKIEEARLADWLANSLKARHSPESFEHGKSKKPWPGKDLKIIQEIWNSLEKRILAEEVDLIKEYKRFKNSAK